MSSELLLLVLRDVSIITNTTGGGRPSSNQIREGSNYKEALECKGAGLGGLVLQLEVLAIGDEEAIYFSYVFNHNLI